MKRLPLLLLAFAGLAFSQQLYDPLSATYQATRPATQDGVSTPTVQQVNPGLLNPGGTVDRQRSAPGAQGVPSVNSEGTRATYSSAIIQFTPAATATDFWQIIGSGSKTVRVLQVAVTGTATSASTVDVQLVKRTTANSGGTTAGAAIAQHDSADSAPTAVINSYSANPGGLGSTTGGGNIRARRLNLGAAGSAGTIVWDFASRNGKGVVLRGVAQSLDLSWNSAAVPAGTVLTIEVEYTEE